jgi:hypothetical protein
MSGDPSTTAKGLYGFSPDIFIYTFDMSDARTLEAYQALMVADCEKATRFARSGFRPMLVMGKEPFEALAPWHQGQGGLKRWRGSYHMGSLPWPTPVPPKTTYLKDLIQVKPLATFKKAPPAVQTGFDFTGGETKS